MNILLLCVCGLTAALDISSNDGFIYYKRNDETVTVVCTFTQGKETKVSWLVNQNTIVFVFTDSCTYSDSECPVYCNHSMHAYTAVIKTSRFHDGALMKCEGFLGYSDKVYSSTIQLRMIIPLQGVDLVPSGFFTLNETDICSINCSAQSIPAASLSWSLDGLPIINTTPPVLNENIVSSTIIYKARKQDLGKTVSCTANDGTVSFKDNVTFNIHYLPNVKVEPSIHNPYNVIENTTHLQFSCKVLDANPIVELYRWYKDGFEISSSVNYTIHTAIPQSSGNYSCDAINDVGTTRSLALRLNVLFGIALDSMDDRNATEESQLVVTCNGISNPPLENENVTWTKKNNNTFKQSGKQLIINNVDRSDKGEYICSATITLKPSIGVPEQRSASKTAIVDILYCPDVVLHPKEFNPYKVIENTTNLQLSCKVLAANPNVTSYRWYKGHLKISELSNYTIYSVNRTDDGNYSCDATNAVGTSLRSSNIHLDILFGILLQSIENQNVTEDSQLVVTCKGISNPPITDENVTWTKNNNNTFKQSGKQLIINNVDRSDRGEYICTATITLKPSIGDPEQRSASTTVTVDIFYRPDVVLHPSTFNPYQVTENTTNLQLVCTVLDANPKVISYGWYKDSHTISDSTISKLSKYTISTVQRANAGNYSCDASNAVGKSIMSSKVQLDVLYGVSMYAMEDQQLIEGAHVVVNCTGASYPAIKDENVNWTKSENKTFFRKGSQLVLYNINRKDRGTYVCSIGILLIPSIGEPASVSASTTVQVNVLYAPTVIIYPTTRNHTVTENDTNVFINCSVVDSNPEEVNISWVKDNKILDFQGNVYRIEEVRKNDNGIYRCYASNIIGSSIWSNEVSLNVQYGSRLNISKTKIEVFEKDPWSIICTADGNPAPEITWIYTHNHSSIISHKYNQLEASLHIKNANCMDTGCYEVKTRNGIGKEDSRSFNVEVYCAPREVMNRNTVNVFINESAYFLKAEFIGYPSPSVTWSFPGNTTGIGSEYNITDIATAYPYKSVSVFSKMNKEELVRGIYNVTAENEYGSFTITFLIDDKDTALDSSSPLIAGLLGAVGFAFLFGAGLIAVVYIVRRRNISGVEKTHLTGLDRGNREMDDDDDDAGLEDNPLYGTSSVSLEATEYAHVQKSTKETNSSKEGIRVKKGKEKEIKGEQIQLGCVYENAEDFSKYQTSNIYGNVRGEGTSTDSTRKNKQNKDGLIYADLEFAPSMAGKKIVIRGFENKTNYAIIDLSKRADSLLTDSDEDDKDARREDKN